MSLTALFHGEIIQVYFNPLRKHDLGWMVLIFLLKHFYYFTVFITVALSIKEEISLLFFQAQEDNN
jgi:hypothetical protein